MSNNRSVGPPREIIEVRMPELPLGARWQPIVGEETRRLLQSLTLPSVERERLLQDSVSVLSRCVPPSGADGTDTGLVVGNIQSGKTMSFTTVSALARDNGYRIIVVITGTVKILFSQSVKRLTNQLQLSSRDDWAWRLYRNPPQSLANDVEALLQDWQRPLPAGLRPQTILFAILKNHTQLRKLCGLLRRLNLTGVPALIIDDEADQAGLNTMAGRGSESSTYGELSRLRLALPHHTYLGYTATPQAPLLINVIDMLSARFAQVLTPGNDYVGGAGFFHHRPPLIRVIPDNQVPSPNNPLHEPPDSLLEAMRVFFIGVAEGIIRHGDIGAPRNRSMLVHPSMLTASHAEYFQWVQKLMASWRRLLDSTDESDRADRDALSEDFHQAYLDLLTTHPALPSFDAILDVLPQALRRTGIYEINTRPNNPFPRIEDIEEFWRSGYPFILVGGQSLERGFTVEGLTVTYMPRGTGVGHADSIQQRARFYGYNRGQLGLCRVYLERSAADAYRGIIEHEDDLRQRLAIHSATGRSLAEWGRLFFLDTTLRPTRDNVLDIDYSRGPEPNKWHTPLPPLYSPRDLGENQNVVAKFMSTVALLPDEGDPRRTLAQRHDVARNVPLGHVLENLVVPLRITEPDDALNFFAIKLQFQRYLEGHPDAMCTVYRMRPAITDELRSLYEGRINPYQGANERTGYPGDMQTRDPARVTVQIHHISTIYESVESKVQMATSVPVIGINIPPAVARSMVVQDQGWHP